MRGTGIGSTLLRRGWVVLLAMLVVGALGYAVAGVRASTYSATAKVVVSEMLGSPSPGNSDAAVALAKTYRRVLPEDQQLHQYVRARLGSTGRISVDGKGGAVLRVTYHAKSRPDALHGADAIADAIASGRQVTASVTPRTLTVVKRPASATRTGPTFGGELILLVSSGATSSGTVSADQAIKLAATYAQVIGSDDQLLSTAAQRVGASERDFEEDLSVVAGQDSALIDITYKASSRRDAVSGARAVAGLVTGGNPTGRGIVPSSIEAVSLPDVSDQKASSNGIAGILGAVLGLLLGIVLLIGWERSDPQLRDARAVSLALGCPATPTDHLSGEGAHALLERWSKLTVQAPARVAILPAGSGAEAATEQVVEHLLASGGDNVSYEDARSGVPSSPANANGLTDVVIVHAGPPGGEGAGEAVALGSDLTVVVLSRGARSADVRSLADTLGDFGVVPAWALLAAKRISAPRVAERERVSAD